MKINYALAREIHGATPWCVDAISLPAMLGVLKDAKNGFSLAAGEAKNNTPFISALKSETRIVLDIKDLKSEADFNGIGIIQIDGPITNSGGASSYGMLELASIMKIMANDNRIKSFIVYADSGGGSSFAVETMQDAIKEVRAMGKDVVGLVRKGGMACSAMYMILSACSKIYVENEMSLVGSNGTMISFNGYAANSQSPDGEKHIEVYATKSVEKNIDFREALNSDNYSLLVDNLLDPLNDRALSRVLENRPQLQGTNWDSGVSIFAKDGIGTYVDGVKSFGELLTEVKFKLENNMTIEQLKNEHPAVYASVVGIGVAQERDRVGSWLAHHDTDSKIVLDGIESGSEIGAATREKLLVKATSAARFASLEQSSTPAILQPESETPSVVKPESNGYSLEVTVNSVKSQLV